MDYLTIKYLHILSATLLFGTGFGTAFYMFVTNRSKDLHAIAVVSRWVVRADWWFTTPAVIIQPLSGAWMIHLAGYAWGAPWIRWSIALYLLAGFCWLPVVWLQLGMHRMAATALASGSALPERYWRYERRWTLLGFPAFGALIVVYWLMVHKGF